MTETAGRTPRVRRKTAAAAEAHERAAPLEAAVAPSVLPEAAPPRNRLNEILIPALNEDFQEHAANVIAAVRIERPVDYLKLVAALLPKTPETSDGALAGLNDEDLAVLLAHIRATLKP
jgi:hypothetical protein